MPRPFKLPPLLKTSDRLVAVVELAVRGFPRYHRYASGAELRTAARRVNDLAWDAWNDAEERLLRLEELQRAISRLKRRIKTCKLIHALTGGQFQELAVLAVEIGAQAGGWRRDLKQHPRVQNAQGRRAVVQRDQKLSTRAASTGANS